MPTLLLGLAFALFGVLTIWDAHQLEQNVRPMALFDVLGPDRYFMLLGGLLLFFAAANLLGSVRGRMGGRTGATTGTVAQEGGDETEEPSRVARYVQLTVLLIAYTAVMPWLGYLPSTLLFFIGALAIMRFSRWPVRLATAVALAVAFHLIFVLGSDMSLPQGLLAP